LGWAPCLQQCTRGAPDRGQPPPSLLQQIPSQSAWAMGMYSAAHHWRKNRSLCQEGSSDGLLGATLSKAQHTNLKWQCALWLVECARSPDSMHNKLASKWLAYARYAAPTAFACARAFVPAGCSTCASSRRPAQSSGWCVGTCPSHAIAAKCRRRGSGWVRLRPGLQTALWCCACRRTCAFMRGETDARA